MTDNSPSKTARFMSTSFPSPASSRRLRALWRNTSAAAFGRRMRQATTMRACRPPKIRASPRSAKSIFGRLETTGTGAREVAGARRSLKTRPSAPSPSPLARCPFEHDALKFKHQIDSAESGTFQYRADMEIEIRRSN
jgi:hypothetical protein